MKTLECKTDTDTRNFKLWKPWGWRQAGSGSHKGLLGFTLFFNCKKYCCCDALSHVWLFASPWTVAHQAPLSMGFARQEYWSGLHLLLQEIFLTQGSNPHLLHRLHWQVCSLPLESPGVLPDNWRSNAKGSLAHFHLFFHLWFLVTDGLHLSPLLSEAVKYT